MEIDFEQFIRDNELTVMDLEHRLGMLQQQNEELKAEVDCLKHQVFHKETFIGILGKTNEEWADLCHRQRETIRSMKGELGNV
jgi:hypothetical protein